MAIKIGQTVYYVARKWAKADCPVCKGIGTIIVRPIHRKYTITCPACEETYRRDMRLNLFQVFKGTVTRIEKHEYLTKKGHTKHIEYSGIITKGCQFSGEKIVFASKKKAIEEAERLNKDFINKEC